MIYTFQHNHHVRSSSLECQNSTIDETIDFGHNGDPKMKLPRYILACLE